MVQMGEPVKDANQVKIEIGSGDLRLIYGTANNSIPFSGGEKLPGQSATYKLPDHTNAGRQVQKETTLDNKGAKFAQTQHVIDPEVFLLIPEIPCQKFGFIEPCYPEPIVRDRDLDGVLDPRH